MAQGPSVAAQLSKAERKAAKRKARRARAKAAASNALSAAVQLSSDVRTTATQPQPTVSSSAPAVKSPPQEEVLSHDTASSRAAISKRDGNSRHNRCRPSSNRQRQEPPKSGSASASSRTAHTARGVAATTPVGIAPVLGSKRSETVYTSGGKHDKARKRARESENHDNQPGTNRSDVGSAPSVADRRAYSAVTMPTDQTIETALDAASSQKKRKGNKKKKMKPSIGSRRTDSFSTSSKDCIVDGNQQGPSSSCGSAGTGKNTDEDDHPVNQTHRSENHGGSAGGGSQMNSGRRSADIANEQQRQQQSDTRGLSKALESVRKRHREEVGKKQPLIGWDIAAFAKFAFEEFVVASPRTARIAGMGRTMQGDVEASAGVGSAEDDEEVVAAAVAAVIASAEEDHAGQVTISEFETLIRKEAAGLAGRRQAGILLRRALEHEQEGDLEAAEAGCIACLASWPGCGEGHMKLAQILRAKGESEQRAIRDVEFHLRQALGCATKARKRGGGEAAEVLGQSAAERLSLLMCQEGRDKEAAKVLRRHGFRYRLSPHVLRYQLPQECPPESARKQSPETEGRTNGDVDEAAQYVAAMDSALPAEMLDHLQEAFRSGSRFWSEHGYNSETGTPGYFSYIHSLDKAPSTSIEQVINHLRGLAESKFPGVKEAKFVEWWAHRRPHSSGHQMHFDSDNEGRGGVRNPIISLVVYVTGDVGGPTLVTTQRLTSKRLADRGWIVHPRVNRVCMFDGGVLHGVIPGRGIPHPTASAALAEMALVPPQSPRGGSDRGRISGTTAAHETVDQSCGGVTEQGTATTERAAVTHHLPSEGHGSERSSGSGNSSSKKRKKKRCRPSSTDGETLPCATMPVRSMSHGLSHSGSGSADDRNSGGSDEVGATCDKISSSITVDPRVIPREQQEGEERAGMRVTWMVAFWKDIEARHPPGAGNGPGAHRKPGSPPSGAGAAQPFPALDAPEGERGGRTWPELFRKKPDGWGGVGEGERGRAWTRGTPVIPVAVPQVWEDVDAAENRKMGAGVRRLKRLPDYDLCFQGF